MRIGIWTSTENIEIVDRLGYDYIELAVTEIMGMSEIQFDSLLEKLSKSRIKCECMNYLIPGDIKVVGPNVDKVQFHSYITKAMKRVGKLGVEFIVFGSGGSRTRPEGWSEETTWKQLAEACTILGDEASKVGATIVIETIIKGSVNTMNYLYEGLRMVKDLNHPNVKLLADYWHMVKNGEDMAIIGEAGHCIKHCHIASKNEASYPLVTDEDDYTVFVNELKKINYEGRLTIESRVNDLENKGSLSLTYLKALTGK